ncbi:MAG: 3'-5' exoribonuclease domain-containing protein [Pyrinomonadaceae bacterium]
MHAEIYISTDIAVDGPIPGPHSMLSIGSAAYAADKTLLATFTANLQPLPAATSHPDTMAWWLQQPAAWAACRTNLQPPEEVMRRYDHWLKQLPGKPIFVGYPAAFDFMFVYWYLMTFVRECPFARLALDIRSYAMAVLGKAYHESGRDKMPARWLKDRPHTHVALDDAIEQGEIFCMMLQENLRRNHFTHK